MRIKKLGYIIDKERIYMRNEKESYPEWKMKIIQKYLPDFSCETQEEKSFNEFFHYAKLYKERYGHVNIKHRDVIDSFHIGHRLGTLKRKCISKENLKKFEELGISLEKKHQEVFNRKMELVKQAIADGIIISNSNQIYKGVNLYQWKKSHLKDFTKDELEIIDKLIPSAENKVPIQIINADSNKVVNTYTSINEAGKALYYDFHITENDKQGLGIIFRRLKGKTKDFVYKGYRFEYADNQRC